MRFAGANVVVTTYNQFDALSMEKELFEILGMFDASQTLEENLARLDKEQDIQLAPELLQYSTPTASSWSLRPRRSRPPPPPAPPKARSIGARGARRRRRRNTGPACMIVRMTFVRLAICIAACATALGAVACKSDEDAGSSQDEIGEGDDAPDASRPKKQDGGETQVLGPSVECAVGGAVEVESNNTAKTATAFTELTFCGVLDTAQDIDYSTFGTPPGRSSRSFRPSSTARSSSRSPSQEPRSVRPTPRSSDPAPTS